MSPTLSGPLNPTPAQEALSKKALMAMFDVVFKTPGFTDVEKAAVIGLCADRLSQTAERFIEVVEADNA